MGENDRTIHDEDGYDAALAEVNALMDAAPGTAEGVRLALLIELIEAYEAKHWSIGGQSKSLPA